MASVEHSIDVLRPIGDVFDYAANPERWTEWGSVFRRASAPDQGMRSGSTFRASASFLGRSVDTTFEIDEVARPEVFRFRAVDGPVKGRFEWRFAPDDLGTRFTFSVAVEGGGVSRVAGSMILSAASRQIREDMERLKGILEAPATGAG